MKITAEKDALITKLRESLREALAILTSGDPSRWNEWKAGEIADLLELTDEASAQAEQASATTLVVRFDVSGGSWTSAQIAALADEAIAQGEESDDHPEARATHEIVGR